MSKTLILLTCAVSITICTCAEIPPSLKKCDRKDKNFHDCLPAAVTDALRKSPNKQIGLIAVDPLDIPSLVIAAGTGAVGFQQNYKDLTLKGLGDAKCGNGRMDFKAKTLALDCHTPLARLDFQYEINGKILLLPIYGKGPGFMELVDLDFNIIFNLEDYEKNGQTHYKVSNNNFTLTPKLMRFYLGNLFDGDEALGKNINQVLNDNWLDVFKDVKTSYEDAFGQIFSSIFNNVLTKVSASELFGEA